MKLHDLVIRNYDAIHKQILDKIHARCKHNFFQMEIEYDPAKKEPYALILYYKTKLVSEITWDFTELEEETGVELEISSSTPEPYRDRKYNNILRAATLSFCPFLRFQNKPVRVLSSNAVIKLTMYSLLSFGFTPQFAFDRRDRIVTLQDKQTVSKQQLARMMDEKKIVGAYFTRDITPNQILPVAEVRLDDAIQKMSCQAQQQLPQARRQYTPPVSSSSQQQQQKTTKKTRRTQS